MIIINIDMDYPEVSYTQIYSDVKSFILVEDFVFKMPLEISIQMCRDCFMRSSQDKTQTHIALFVFLIHSLHSKY